MRAKTLVLNARDNVANALVDLHAEECVRVDVPERGELVIHLKQSIPLGHKLALKPIPIGAPAIKYGVPIGTATQDIAAGDHVHIHNLE